jgi:hypothetical protein
MLDDISNHEICTFTHIYGSTKPRLNMHNMTLWPINDVDSVVDYKTWHGISLK